MKGRNEKGVRSGWTTSANKWAFIPRLRVSCHRHAISMSTPIRIRESCLRVGRKMQGTRWPADRAEIKYFLRACARTEFIGFPRLDSTNFAAVALFSLRSALLKLFARKLPAISLSEKKKKRKKTETRGKENQVDRWNNSNRRIKRSRDRNCLNALPSFFLPFPLFVFPVFFSFPPPLSSSSSFFLPAIL